MNHDIGTLAGRPTTGESLNAVRAEIPEPCYDRSTMRAALAVVQAVVLYALPIAGLAVLGQWWQLALLWPLAGLGVAGLFVLGHDASHGVLVRSARANRVLAQLLMAPSLHAEAAWDLGHNRIHHGYTTRQGFDFVWHPTTADEFEVMTRGARLRHRLEWSWAGSGAYYLRTVWWSKMWHFAAPGKRHDAIVRDKVVLATAVGFIVAATSALAASTGSWVGALFMPVKLFVVPFLIFSQIIGWTVYVHHVSPQIRWWSRRDWNQFKGQMESTTIIRIPSTMNLLWFHNIFVHVPHHVDTRIRFDHLPDAAVAIEMAHPHTVRSVRMSVRRYVATTVACKLYDFDMGRWTTYRER